MREAGAPENRADKSAGAKTGGADSRRTAAVKSTAGAKDKPSCGKKRSAAAASEPEKNEARQSPGANTGKPSKGEKAKHNDEKTEKAGAGSRTPQVMKLIEPLGDVNPVIIAGKSRIPQQLRGKAPLSRIMRREAAEIFGESFYTDPNEIVTADLTELVIRENAGELLRRFNACCCDKCIDELSRRAAEKIPSRFVRVTRAELERGVPELEEYKEPLRKSALSAMIRELLGNKRRHFHNG